MLRQTWGALEELAVAEAADALAISAVSGADALATTIRQANATELTSSLFSLPLLFGLSESLVILPASLHSLLSLLVPSSDYSNTEVTVELLDRIQESGIVVLKEDGCCALSVRLVPFRNCKRRSERGVC